MPINIFNRSKSKKVLTKAESKSYYNDEYSQMFLVPIEDLKLYITDFWPISKDEWIATNTLAIYQSLIHLHATVDKACTLESCPVMTAGGQTIFWVDEKGKKQKISAPEYINLAIISLEKFLCSEEKVPTRTGVPFPPSFRIAVQKNYKIIGNIFCHFYTVHFDEFIKAKLCLHLNTVFYHFLLLCELDHIIEPKDLEPLDDLVKKWLPSFSNSTVNIT